MVLTALSVLARLGVIAASTIVLGLNGVFIADRSWLTGVLVYIEVITAISIVGAIIPPYPNFLYDFILFIALILGAIFALIVQVFQSPCYGFRVDTRANCSSYKASTAFAFLAAFAWLASATFGALRILGVIFGVSERMSSGNNYVGANLTRLNNEADLGEEVKKERNTKRVKSGLPERTNDLTVVLTAFGRGFLNANFTRYFICYGILAVVLVSTALPLIFVYAVPAFGQYLLAGVPLPAVNITLSNPGNSTIEFTVTSNITVPDKFKISLQPATISFFQHGPDPGTSPFAAVDLPETTWYSNEKVGVVNQTLQLKNLTEFAKLIQQVAYFPTFKVSGSARAKVHVGPINTWVNLYKVVELTAFDNFTAFDVRKIGIQEPDADGNDVYGEVVVYNPSPASVTLGDVTLDVLIGDVVVGQAATTVNNIVPGNNTFEIKGKLNSTAVLNDTLALVQTEFPFLEQELVVASVRGLSVVYDGQHLPYWEEAFQLLRITATKPVLPLLNALINSTANELLGDNQFVSPALNFLVDLLVRLLKSIPPQDEAGFEQVVGEIAAILVKILQGLGLV